MEDGRGVEDGGGLDRVHVFNVGGGDGLVDDGRDVLVLNDVGELVVLNVVEDARVGGQKWKLFVFQHGRNQGRNDEFTKIEDEQMRDEREKDKIRHTSIERGERQEKNHQSVL